jgi:hypothetical protein
MKALFSLLLCLAPGLALAQAPAALRPDSATQRLARAEAVLVPGARPADLAARARRWLAAAYQTTPTGVPQAPGVLQATGWREIESLVDQDKSLPLKLWYTVTLAVQPGGYRFTITNFQTQGELTPADPTPEKHALEAVLRAAPAQPLPPTDYGQQAAAVAQAVEQTIRASMAGPVASR